MLTLIKNARVFAPQDCGQLDLLVAGSQILAMEPNLAPAGLPVETVDAGGQWLIPGLVDSLVHITGGGGEGGYATRTPELNAEDAVRAGVTTLVGVLGTDATCRSLGELFGKTQALRAQGLNCYMHSGSYQLPVKTLTGDLRQDIMLIDPVLGVGEVAIADHRGSQPSWQELARLASDARVAGMLSGKSGVVSIHVGEDETALQLLHDVVDNTAIPINQFYPTHIGRSDALIEKGVAYAKRGGYLDFTTSTTEAILAMGERRAADALMYALELGAPLAQMTLSSDAQGSLPHFNAAGRLDGLEVAAIGSLWDEVRSLFARLPAEKALAVATLNPARVLGLGQAGRVKAGMAATFNLVDAETHAVRSVMSNGKWLMREQELTFRRLFAE
ncbi:beta-aspartyl-peptidase [Simiduia sp. 21SJ11W-1]|uniref:beta-aspartyl-peptidase n=1 Tax=Simiduia sp. 21SJ11W-1 TaxID=2909669 RepID=UPI00209D34AD|nr:beta-aspartyl-peptidase [Simiduia sp. 21SJ11W-1]UTA47718.1 beta-aspartyl-peptidase [Simiduia sp. 21SJ11W-1]